MKVTLAVQYEGKAPDTDIELPDHVAKQLLAYGQARPVKTTPTKEQKEADAVAEAVLQNAEEARAAAAPATKED